METIITADEVINISFNPKDQVDSGVINEFRIESAQLKYIAPVLGNVYKNIISGEHAEFSEKFIKPALAFYVKYTILGELSVKIGNSGITRNRNTNYEKVSAQEISRLRRETKETADLLLKKAIAFIIDNRELFSEYTGNINDKKATVNGGIII